MAVKKITTEEGCGNDRKIILDEKALKSVLKNDKWSNCLVAVYSIAGPYRSGKSFLLSLLYRYLKFHNQV